MSQTSKLSLIAQFDDLMRCVWGLLDGDVTEHYTETVRSFEMLCGKALETENECQRLQQELSESLMTISGLEKKLCHARRMHDAERRGRLKAEKEIEVLDRNMNLARDILFNDHHTQLNDETREKLMQIHNSTTKSRRSIGDRNSRLNTINELETTGSLLSDLSYSKSEDDILNATQNASWSEHVSLNEVPHQKKRRSSVGKVFEINDNDRVIATTTLTVNKDNGQVHARSIIEAIAEETEPENSNPARYLEGVHPAFHNDQLDYIAKSKYNSPIGKSPMFSSPVVQSLRESRQHTFITKTCISRQICGHCGKKITFGTMISRCKDCRAIAHTKECSEKVPLPCVPVGDTPTLKGQMGSIAQYAPKFPPMIPSLIVHCVNEIELRGLTEIGLYRIPGSEKDVKSLKEAFLRGKGAPNLSNIEIHVICGAVKDFLRSIKEPLLTSKADFVRAIEANDPNDIEPILYQIIAELPQPNRDTLAFLMIHLQKVGASKECKMPLSNLSKIFGPTLVGYSSPSQDFNDVLTETRQQVNIVEHLLNIPSDYWTTFIDVNGLQARPNVPELKQTPSTESLFKNNPRFFTTPLQAGAGKEVRKRKFFDNTPSKKKMK